MNRSIWCLLIVACLVLGISLFGIISVVNAPSPGGSATVFLPCADGEEDDAYDCNDGEGYDLFDLPVAQTYEESLKAEALDFSAPTDRDGIIYRGVNLAGGECEDDVAEHLASHGEFLPFDNAAELFLYKGMNTFRIAVVWEYLADREGYFFFPAHKYMLKLDATIKGLTDKGASVILDLHNYARYNPRNVALNRMPTDQEGPDVLSPTHLYRMWYNLASRYSSPRIIYGMMHEPHDITNTTLNALIRAAFSGIRDGEKASGVPLTNTHLILVPGNNYDRLHTWFKRDIADNQGNSYNANNYRALATFKELNREVVSKFALEIHHHFDDHKSAFSGLYLSGECLDTKSYIEWVRKAWPKFLIVSKVNEYAVFVSEFGAPDTPTCRANVAHFLGLLEQDRYTLARKYGVIGWAVSGGGTPGCGKENHILSLAPGGRANSLMWGESLYERFTDDVARPIPPLLEEARLAMVVHNSGPQTLRYLRGYVPFQLRGDVDIKSGESGKIYSNNGFSTPTPAISRHYYINNKLDQIVFGFTPQLSGHVYAYANVGRSNCVTVTNNTIGCPVSITGPTSNPGEPRCKTLLPIAGC